MSNIPENMSITNLGSIVHIGVEVVVMGGLAFWLNRKIDNIQKNMEDRISVLEQKHQELEKILQLHANALNNLSRTVNGQVNIDMKNKNLQSPHPHPHPHPHQDINNVEKKEKGPKRVKKKKSIVKRDKIIDKLLEEELKELNEQKKEEQSKEKEK